MSSFGSCQTQAAPQPSSAFPTPTMSHSDLSRPVAVSSAMTTQPPSLYSKAIKKTLSATMPSTITPTSAATTNSTSTSNTTTTTTTTTTTAAATTIASTTTSPATAALALSMPSPPMSPHPRLAKPLGIPSRTAALTDFAQPEAADQEEIQSQDLAEVPSTSLLLLSTTADLHSDQSLSHKTTTADRFPHKFLPMKTLAARAAYKPAPGTSQSKLAQLGAERRTIETGPVTVPFADYPTGTYQSRYTLTEKTSVPLVSCSWDAIRKNPRTILNRERAFLANYKPHGAYTSFYTVTAHASVNTRSIKSLSNNNNNNNNGLVTCAPSPRKSVRRVPTYYDDSDGIATRSRHRTNQARARVAKQPVVSSPKPSSVLAISSLIEDDIRPSSPRKPLHFEPIAPAPCPLPPIAFASPVATPEPPTCVALPASNTSSSTSTSSTSTHGPISFSSINQRASTPSVSCPSPVVSSPKRSPRASKPHQFQRKPRPTPIPSRVHDMEASELPDYAPPATLLPPGKKLKTEWKGSPMDLSRDPHMHLLHPAEVPLAATLRLPAELYLDSKKRLFAEKVHRLRQGLPFRRTDAQKACRIDVNKASRLFSSYEKVGWLEDKVFAKFL
ncbi:uncharacterized protein SAPINGB_P004028 [Magnusiomyces paraingens]|uniref:SWIRM domain-containing protein n=1 Tax=Magnusiomyces paraingens TaxID=2606893 RepID=A0A5E8BSE6_9ASCO|nr:uncharacterized protein SAPINGB_P004028 [Saprochaete ingens]VVT54343.1 unnamed protein product [Saprochaete ingens]